MVVASAGLVRPVTLVARSVPGLRPPLSPPKNEAGTSRCNRTRLCQGGRHRRSGRTDGSNSACLVDEGVFVGIDARQGPMLIEMAAATQDSRGLRHCEQPGGCRQGQRANAAVVSTAKRTQQGHAIVVELTARCHCAQMAEEALDISRSRAVDAACIPGRDGSPDGRRQLAKTAAVLFQLSLPGQRRLQRFECYPPAARLASITQAAGLLGDWGSDAAAPTAHDI